VYGYSFILTNYDVSTPARAAAVEHWYRHRTEIENIFRDSKHAAALRHLPSGYPEVHTAWMWGALLATSIAGWLPQLIATSPATDDPDPEDDAAIYPSTPEPLAGLASATAKP
jgi:hypothetical protein